MTVELCGRAGAVDHRLGPEPRVLVPSDGPFTFGRGTDCSLTLDGTDRSISRLAGSIGWDGERWVLRNESNSRPLYCITEPGLRRLLATGQEVLPLSPGRLRVQVTGVRTHELSLVVEGADEAARPDSNAEESKSVLEATTSPSVTVNERVAILALAEGTPDYRATTLVRGPTQTRQPVSRFPS